MKTPDYKKIYSDIIRLKHPEKETICQSILLKKRLNFIDVLSLNKKIFGTTELFSINQKYRAYDKVAIFKILDYQKEHNLNNIQLASHFRMSRNTITKWKKTYI